MFRNFGALRASLDDSISNTIIVAAAHDKHTLEAVFAASKLLPMRYTLVGQQSKITSICSDLGVSILADSIVDATDNLDCAQKAVGLVRQGRGSMLMKGILETGTLLKAVLDKENGIRHSGVMSHMVLLEVPQYHKLITVTDAGMNPYPSLEQKVHIVLNAVDFYEKLGFTTPNIAALTAVESVNEKMPETVDAHELQKMCQHGNLGSYYLEGPLSFDIAVSKESAEIKGFCSKVSGESDTFLVPNITVGNVLCKSLLYWGNAKMAGCVLGAKVPIVLVSRGATAEEKLLSIMLCLKIGQKSNC